MVNNKVEKFWENFVSSYSEYQDIKYRDIYKFCDNEQDANECAELVVQGIKRATAASKWWHDHSGEPLPEVGDINIVTDWDDNPVAVIKTTKVDLVPFNQVSAEFAATEGEGDKSLEYWKRVHWDFYTRELSPFGRKPTKDMVIVCEEFEKIS